MKREFSYILNTLSISFNHIDIFRRDCLYMPVCNKKEGANTKSVVRRSGVGYHVKSILVSIDKKYYVVLYNKNVMPFTLEFITREFLKSLNATGSETGEQ